jgi:hypothetical protein
MNKETLRMQFLSGVITESEYKTKLEEATQKDSLNEHYVAGGIVGIGAINQIPPRTKAVYEDAFEHFLGQKYGLNEVEDSQAVAAAEKVEDSVEDKVNIDDLSDEEKNQLRNALSKLGITADSSIEDVADKIENKIESTLSEAEENPNKKFSDALSAVGGGLLASHLVPLIPLIVGHMSGIGFFGGLAVTLGTAGALIGLAKALGDGLEEGKEDLQQTDVKSAIDGKKLDLDKLKNATEKAMKGDSTDLTLFLAGVFEGKEPSLYEDESPTKEEIAAFEAAVDKLVYMTGMSKEDAIAAIGRVAQTK